jgi:serine/threonine-protein kinase
LLSWGIVELAPEAVIAGRYSLERCIGKGGMGSVWAATHRVTRARVALKFLRVPADDRASLRERFLAEARAATAIEHPNVIQVIDVFELDDHTPVMVLDLLEGETLGERLDREEQLDVRETASVLLPVASAVAKAHELGIVHRDLKPENIFLAEAEGAVVPMVLDFGIAKLLEHSAEAEAVVTGTGVMLGTAGYMAPEQGFGEKDIDGRADLWAFGVMLYECLSGVKPIEADNLGQYLKRLMDHAITPLEVLEPDLDPEVTALVGRLLARERDERPDDLVELLAVLGRFADEPAAMPRERSRRAEPIDPDAATEHAGVAGTLAATNTRAIATGRERERRALWPWLGLAVAAGVAWLALGGRSQLAESHAAEPSRAESSSAEPAAPPPSAQDTSARALPVPERVPVDAGASSRARPAPPVRAIPTPTMRRPARKTVAPSPPPRVAAPPPPPPAVAPPAPPPPPPGGLVDEPPF